MIHQILEILILFALFFVIFEPLFFLGKIYYFCFIILSCLINFFNLDNYFFI